MLTLIFILLVAFMSLTVVLWAGTYFFQGYIYTEPSPGIYWQAPAAALLLTFGYAIWCATIAYSAEARVTNIPINVFWKFSPHEDMLKSPADNIWAIKPGRNKEGHATNEDRVLYTRSTSHDGSKQTFQYKDPYGRTWQGRDVIALEIEVEDKSNPEQKNKMRFDLAASDVEDYRNFVSSDGWTMREWNKDGRPSGLPERFRLSRLLLNLFFNAAHLVLWFLGLWLILRFQWSHALGFAFVMWLVFSIILLPMMLGNAAEVAESRRTASITISPLAV